MSALRVMRHHERWSGEELRRLEDLFRLRLNATQIARELGRKPKAVAERKRIVGLAHKPEQCHCGLPLTQGGPGRPRVYCSERCRQDLREAYARNERIDAKAS
jgi:hypothetical protein